MQILVAQRADADTLADLFLSHIAANPAYISHGEMQMGVGDGVFVNGELVAAPAPDAREKWMRYILEHIEDDSFAEVWKAVTPDGRIVVSLRKSGQDGFYDIVVEDNGPGVSDEHIERLFTPNFTTKNGGSGLGLAISRNILERCGATISYSRSFSLGGACFTIKYPI